MTTDRIKEIQEKTAYPNSVSVQQALLQVWNECQQQNMTKELYEFGKLVLDTFHSEGKTHSGDDRLSRIKFDEWFNSVSKK